MLLTNPVVKLRVYGQLCPWLGVGDNRYDKHHITLYMSATSIFTKITFTIFRIRQEMLRLKPMREQHQ